MNTEERNMKVFSAIFFLRSLKKDKKPLVPKKMMTMITWFEIGAEVKGITCHVTVILTVNFFI